MVKADVSSFDESSYLIETAHKNFGRIDLLVNNAGITRDKLLIQMSKNDFTDVIDTNLNGTFNCIRHVAKRMIRQKSGRIVNIASVIGLMGNIGQSNYSASKAGVIGITKSAAKELARKNITCNAIAPGFIDTEMTSDLNDEAKKNILKNIPLSCFGKPSNIADLVSFLASDKASYITGQVISVDGGLYI
jgi:3-oxoacyl-[acyl-carrier protein] reductase